MLHYMKRSSKGRNLTSGKKYSVEMYIHIFKTFIKNKKMTREYHFPSHLSEIYSVNFKLAKKQ